MEADKEADNNPVVTPSTRVRTHVTQHCFIFIFLSSTHDEETGQNSGQAQQTRLMSQVDDEIGLKRLHEGGLLMNSRRLGSRPS